MDGGLNLLHARLGKLQCLSREPGAGTCCL